MKMVERHVIPELFAMTFVTVSVLFGFIFVSLSSSAYLLCFSSYFITFERTHWLAVSIKFSHTIGSI